MTKHDSKTADELILEDAPEGATHCKNKPTRTDTVFYYKVSDDYWYFWSREKWFIYHECTTFMRSLADITELVELRKKNAELEKVFANVLPVVAFLAREGVIQTDRGLKVEFDEWLAIRYLEQQAKGANDAIESALGDPKSLTNEALSIRYEFLERLRHMLEQAKQLKEQNN